MFNRYAASARVIDRSTLERNVPSVFATEAFHTRSDRYKFIPTIQVIDFLADHGFLPVKAHQSRSRIEGKTAFTKHMIRLRRAEDIGRSAEEFPELVMVNSHDGTSAYKFMFGVFRVVCSNGMIAMSEDYGSLKVRHMGSGDFHKELSDATTGIMANAPKVLTQIEGWKQLALSAPERQIFAESAAKLIDNNVSASNLVRARREADRGEPTLWKTLNTVQENILQGGTYSVKGRQTSAVKDISKDIKLNTALWSLAEKMSQLKATN